MKGHGSKSKVSERRKTKTRKCCVCRETKNSQNHFHPVPKMQQRRRAWEMSLGMELKQCYRVCSNHFEAFDYIPSSKYEIKKSLLRVP